MLALDSIVRASGTAALTSGRERRTLTVPLPMMATPRERGMRDEYARRHADLGP